MKFKIDAKAEAKNIPYLIKELAGEQILNPILKEKIGKDFSDKHKIFIEVKNLHKKYNSKLRRELKFSNLFFKKVESQYNKELEKLFERKIDKNKDVYFAPSLYGVADVLGRKNVFIGCEWSNVLDYLILHELVHLHYSDALVKLKLFKNGGKSPLMEGVAHLIIFKTDIKDLIKSPEAYYENIYFVKENRNFMNKLEEKWDRRKNFKSFMIEAIKLNNGTKGVKIC